MYIIFSIVALFGSFAVGVVVGRRSEARTRTQLASQPLVGTSLSGTAPDLFVEQSDDESTDPRLAAAQAAIQSRTEARLARILAQAQADGRITNDGAEELFCISDRTASAYLSELTKRGDLVRKGAGRGTFYTPQ